MRKPQVSDGFGLAFALSLLWTWPLGLAATILWALRLVLGILGGLWLLITLIWVVGALVRTALLDWGAKASQHRDPPKENKNPYSVKEEKPKAEGFSATEEIPVSEVTEGSEAEEPPAFSEEGSIEDTLKQLEENLLSSEAPRLEGQGQTSQMGG